MDGRHTHTQRENDIESDGNAAKADFVGTWRQAGNPAVNAVSDDKLWVLKAFTKKHSFRTKPLWS